jgi:hypothetical protein
MEVVLEAVEWNDCGESEYRAWDEDIGFRQGLRPILGLEVSDTEVVAEADDFIVGVFNILPANGNSEQCFMSARIWC